MSPYDDIGIYTCARGFKGFFFIGGGVAFAVGAGGAVAGVGGGGDGGAAGVVGGGGWRRWRCRGWRWRRGRGFGRRRGCYYWWRFCYYERLIKGFSVFMFFFWGVALATGAVAAALPELAALAAGAAAVGVPVADERLLDDSEDFGRLLNFT